MRVLGIESSCDETAAAVVEDGRRLWASEIASSAALQSAYGGVVPEVAAREHVAVVTAVVERALKTAGLDPTGIDAVAVTQGPGLLGALLIGVTAAKSLALALSLPVVGVHHLEAHLYANALEGPLEFPALALIVSGGHTMLLQWNGHGDLVALGETRDDAAGEAFDKGARILGLGYPGGPQIERAADGANASDDLRLPVARVGGYDFSFSGVKTAMRELYQRHPDRRDTVARALEQAVVTALVQTTLRAANDFGLRRIYLAGGVSANRRLRRELGQSAADQGIAVRVPRPAFCTDNGAMVAAAGYFRLLDGARLDAFEGPRVDWRLGVKPDERGED